MNLFKNFQLIDKYGLPHPKWEFVKSSAELKKFNQTKDYCGWTIRVLFTKGENFREPIYDNWVPKNKVKNIIDEFAGKAKKDFVIAVYPSWKLNKSGTLLIDKKQITIESCKGHVSELMRKGKVESGLIYNKQKKLISHYDNKNFLTAEEKKKILSACDKIKTGSWILEWAVGQQNEFIFYKLENLKEAAKNLLKKYG